MAAGPRAQQQSATSQVTQIGLEQLVQDSMRLTARWGHVAHVRGCCASWVRITG